MINIQNVTAEFKWSKMPTHLRRFIDLLNCNHIISPY